jgi:hypothetical protein
MDQTPSDCHADEFFARYTNPTSETIARLRQEPTRRVTSRRWWRRSGTSTSGTGLLLPARPGSALSSCPPVIRFLPG